MKTEIHTLTNGLRVVIADTKAFPSLTTLLLVGAGSRYENKLNNGIAHFFEHMAFKGSKKYPTSMILSSTIEAFGGVFNAFTTKDHTGYWIKAPTEHFETVVDVIADMIQNPLLKQEEIDREKGVIIEEINMYEDTPARRVGELFEQLLYPDNPLGYDIAGSKETVSTFNTTTFTDYMGKLYHPKNAVLVTAGGNVDPKSYIKTIEEKFGSWQNGQQGGFDRVVEKQNKPQVILKTKKTEQAHFCLGFRAYKRSHKSRYVLSVLCTILGGGMSSRLFYEVRERRGLCYYISTSKDLYDDAGIVATQAGVPIVADKVKEAVAVTLAEHKKMKTGDIKKDELERAKELIKGRLILSLEDSSSVANHFGSDLLFEGKIRELKTIMAEIDKVTIDQVVAVAEDIFKPQTLNMALIGPFENSKEFEEILNI